MLSVEIDVQTALQDLDNLNENVQNGLRNAVYQGAVLVRQEAERRAPQSERAHYFYSRRRKDGKTGQKYLFQPGSLKKAIYIKYLPERSADGNRATYQISWREKSSSLGYVPYAHMVEFGTAKSPPYPFLRPAFYSKQKQMEAEIIQNIQQLAKF